MKELYEGADMRSVYEVYCPKCDLIIKHVEDFDKAVEAIRLHNIKKHPGMEPL